MPQIYFEDFESSFDYTVSGVGDAGRKTEGAITGTYSGYVAENTVTADSPVIEATSNLTLNYDVRMGSDSIINKPEGGENLEVYYLNDVGSWVLVDSYNPDFWTEGEVRSFSHDLGTDAEHNNLQIRFGFTGGSGSNFDYWWFDNVELTGDSVGAESTAATSVSDSSATLNGNVFADREVEYWFEWRSTGSATWNATSTQITNSDTPVSETVSVNSLTEYEFRVVVESTDGLYSSTSNTKTFESLSQTPVQLDWTDNSTSEDGFYVYRTTTTTPTFPDDYTQISDVGVDVVSYTDEYAPEDETINYAVTAYNSGGESTETTASITTETQTGSGPLSLTANVATLTGSGISPIATPGARSVTASGSQVSTETRPVSIVPGSTVVTGNTLQSSVSGVSPIATPGRTSITAAGNPIAAGTRAPSIVPGSVSARADLGSVSVSGPLVLVSKDGTIIRVDPGVVSALSSGPSVIPGSVTASGETAQIAATSSSASVVPNTIQVIGDGATAALVAQNTTANPGPVSAQTTAGSVSSSVRSPGVVPGSVLVASQYATLSIEELEARFSSIGSIVADVASGSLLGSDVVALPAGVGASLESTPIGVSGSGLGVVPRPFSVSASPVTATVSATDTELLTWAEVVADPGVLATESASIDVSNLSKVFADSGELVAQSAPVAFSFGSSQIEIDPVNMTVSVPSTFELTSDTIARIVELLGRADYTHNLLGKKETTRDIVTILRK